MKKLISINGMTCDHCVARVDRALSRLGGVKKVKVKLTQNLAELTTTGTDDDEIRIAVSEAGYAVTSIQTQ